LPWNRPKPSYFFKVLIRVDLIDQQRVAFPERSFCLRMAYKSPMAFEQWLSSDGSFPSSGNVDTMLQSSFGIRDHQLDGRVRLC